MTDQYGFQWTPGTLDPQDSYFRLLLKFKTPEMAKRVKRIRALLNMWENRLDWDKTLVSNTTDRTAKVLIITRRWIERPICVSVLTFLCRIGMVYETGESMDDLYAAIEKGRKPLNGGDERLCTDEAKKRVLRVWDERQFPPQKYSDYTSCSYVHNYSGIRNYREDQPHGPIFESVKGCNCGFCEVKRAKEAATPRLGTSPAVGLPVPAPEA